MANVSVTEEALAQIVALPTPIRNRIAGITDRLANWPDVSGVKPLRGGMKGLFRIRTGDYRIVFSVDENQSPTVVTVEFVGNCRDVYE